MHILDGYIRTELLRNYALVNVLLLGLFGFLDLAMQLEDVGKGAYTTGNAVAFMLYYLPRRLVDLTPFSLLLAAVLALGTMASNRELVVMRGCGLSPMKIITSLLKAGGLLLAAVIALELFVAPTLQQQAFQMRTTALAGNSGSAASSLWARSKDGIIYIGNLRHGRIPTDIEIYRFGQHQNLRLYLHAKSADILAPDHWRLHDVTRKRFANGSEAADQLNTLDWRPILSPEQLRILDRPADSLSLPDLYRYTSYLQAQGQNAQRFRMTLWQKLALPLTTIAMMLLAAPLSFANPRASNLGLRIVAGAAIGLGVFTLTQVAANLGLLYNLSPPLLALAPGILLSIIAIYWLRRLT